MQKIVHTIRLPDPRAILLSLLLTLTLLVAIEPHGAAAARLELPGTWSGMTTSATHVRARPDMGGWIVGTLPAHTRVTVYATVAGQLVWGSITNWYLISGPGRPLHYVYAGLIARGAHAAPPGFLAYPTTGKSIVISLSQQRLYAFNDGQQVGTTPITSGQPGMDTPSGTYHIFSKLTATTFYSPVPPGSVGYYAPTYVNYALGFREGGYFIHDATWRSDFGLHTNTRHYDHVYGWETGSHGCVNLPLNVMTWLYSWTPLGASVKILP